jgi:DNA-binding Xre family transcriptional regulator
MSQATDLKNLRALLRQGIEALRRPSRELEQELAISNGSLKKLLDGSQDLRLHHLLAFAHLLQVSPAELLELGCPESHAAARLKITDWIGPVEPKFKKKKAEPAPLPSGEELVELIRRTVREELAAQPAKNPAAKDS